MNIDFSTCNKQTAFGYLQKVYPSKDLTQEMCSKLLDLVGQDILRVQDPFMHGNKIAVTSGNKYKPEFKSQVDEAIEQLKSNGLF